MGAGENSSTKSRFVVCFGTTAIDFVVPVRNNDGSLSSTFNTAAKKSLGGQAANVAVAIRKQGTHDVRLISAIGNDEEGMWAKKQLQDNAIDITSVEVKLAPSLKMKIDLTPPVKAELLSADHAAKQLSALSPNVAGAHLAIAHASHAWDALTRFIDTCAAQNVPIIFNPAPLILLRDLAPLQKADIVIANEDEAREICRRLGVDGSNIEALGLAKELRSKTGRDFIVTLGEKGAVASCKNGEWISPPRPTAIIDPTGAGDTFIGVFASSRLSGLSFADSLHHATTAASLVCEKPGASSSAPNQAEIAAKIHETPKPVFIHKGMPDRNPGYKK